ncbi:acyl-CoA thioesterase [Kamptonema cortianum]|nr:acyl-CoA thioesterase [Kamptonema cortianum]
MTPNDANVLGNVFGGSILALIDLAASSVAQKFSGHVCVTAAFDRVDFHNPIEIGMLVELDGVVSYVGRTSLEVTIDVYATRLTKNERHHVNTARVTMVAIENGKPVPVPRLICETREDKLRFLSGQLRRELKAQRTEQMATLTQKLEQFPDDKLMELINSTTPLVAQLT